MKILTKKIEEITPYENNPRLNDTAVDAVANSIRDFGFKNPVIIDKDGVIVCGHTRLKAAKKLGLKTVPCIMADDLTEDQVKAFRLADNKTAELAEWDINLLDMELTEIDDSIDMELYGFEDVEIDMLADGEEPEYDEPSEEYEPKTKLGDIYKLGDHRLMVGDSTKIDDVEKLVGENKIQLLITDPPYNVALGNHDTPEAARQRHRRTDGLVIQNDSWGSDEEFQKFLGDALSNALIFMDAGAAFYIWFSNRQSYNFETCTRNCGMHVRQTLIWVKNTFTLGRQDYQWRHEPCLYGWKDGAAHMWNSDRKQTTVLEFDKPTKSEDHPTMKPIPLFEHQIKNSSKKGQNVLDLFGGSGTTLLACQNIGRKAFLMECDPRYADVIIRRYEELTGDTAVRIN